MPRGIILNAIELYAVKDNAIMPSVVAPLKDVTLSLHSASARPLFCQRPKVKEAKGTTNAANGIIRKDIFIFRVSPFSRN